jgi:hypothetical protein
MVVLTMWTALDLSGKPDQDSKVPAHESDDLQGESNHSHRQLHPEYRPKGRIPVWLVTRCHPHRKPDHLEVANWKQCQPDDGVESCQRSTNQWIEEHEGDLGNEVVPLQLRHARLGHRHLIHHSGSDELVGPE